MAKTGKFVKSSYFVTTCTLQNKKNFVSKHHCHLEIPRKKSLKIPMGQLQGVNQRMIPGISYVKKRRYFCGTIDSILAKVKQDSRESKQFPISLVICQNNRRSDRRCTLFQKRVVLTKLDIYHRVDTSVDVLLVPRVYHSSNKPVISVSTLIWFIRNIDYLQIFSLDPLISVLSETFICQSFDEKRVRDEGYSTN